MNDQPTTEFRKLRQQRNEVASKILTHIEANISDASGAATTARAWAETYALLMGQAPSTS